MRTPLPFAVDDLSALARFLSRELKALAEPPGHVQMLNLLARSAGHRNFQALKARSDQDPPRSAPQEPAVDAALVDRTARYFDAQGRLASWPSRRAQQRLCLWFLWSRIPTETDLSEPQVNERLKAAHLFGDHALLRRDMVDMGLLTRTRDGRAYRRVERPPEPEALALIRRLG
ncbi:MAG: DUF2087 domain-containing protein [Caulobacter sp.]